MAAFEDLIAWQKARELTKKVYSASTKGEFGRDYGLKDQIRRSAVSVMSNLAEGHERGGRAEFHQFLVIAKGSCAEVLSQLYVAYDVGYLDQQQFADLKEMTSELGRIIGGLRAAVKNQTVRRG
jgi:four helix bundle protein